MQGASGGDAVEAQPRLYLPHGPREEGWCKPWALLGPSEPSVAPAPEESPALSLAAPCPHSTGGWRHPSQGEEGCPRAHPGLHPLPASAETGSGATPCPRLPPHGLPGVHTKGGSWKLGSGRGGPARERTGLPRLAPAVPAPMGLRAPPQLQSVPVTAHCPRATALLVGLGEKAPPFAPEAEDPAREDSGGDQAGAEAAPSGG